MEEISNNLQFRKIPQYNAMGLMGVIDWRMSDINELLKQGYRLGNFRDAALGSMEKYNPKERIDRHQFEINVFTFIGNPVISDPDLSGERLIINDLEQKVFEPLKIQILNITPYDYSFSLAPTETEAVEIYNKFKTEGGRFVTVISSKTASSALLDEKERIINGLFSWNETECRDYIRHIQTVKNIGNRKEVFEKMFQYPNVEFTGLKFLSLRKLNNNQSTYLINANIYDAGCFLVVNKYTFLRHKQ